MRAVFLFPLACAVLVAATASGDWEGAFLEDEASSGTTRSHSIKNAAEADFDSEPKDITMVDAEPVRPGELDVTVALDKPVVAAGKDLEVPESVLKERRFTDMAKVRPERELRISAAAREAAAPACV
jgi:hypothetical protein